MKSNGVERRTVIIHRPAADVHARLEQLCDALPGAQVTAAPDSWGSAIAVLFP